MIPGVPKRKQAAVKEQKTFCRVKKSAVWMGESANAELPIHTAFFIS